MQAARLRYFAQAYERVGRDPRAASSGGRACCACAARHRAHRAGHERGARRTRRPGPTVYAIARAPSASSTRACGAGATRIRRGPHPVLDGFGGTRSAPAEPRGSGARRLRPLPSPHRRRLSPAAAALRAPSAQHRHGASPSCSIPRPRRSAAAAAPPIRLAARRRCSARADCADARASGAWAVRRSATQRALAPAPRRHRSRRARP